MRRSGVYMETISNIFWLIVILIIILIIGSIILGVVRCANGGDDGWRNNFTVVISEETEDYTTYLIGNDASNPVAGENKYVYIDSITFRVETSKGRVFDYEFAADFEPMQPFAYLTLQISAAQIEDYMIWNGIPGKVKRFEIINIKHKWRDLAEEARLTDPRRLTVLI